MALTAQAGIFGFGAQTGKGSVATTFYKHKASNIDLGLIDDVRLGPLEIGGSPFPTFPYKAGYLVGGGVDIMPRLEGTLGWLLYAMLGDVTSTQVGGTAEWSHQFEPLSSDYSAVKWLTLKKYIPQKDADAASDLGELYTDCKPLGMMLNLAADAPIAARWDFIGRTYTAVPDISAWAWQNTAYEDWQTIPVGCEVTGDLKFTGGGLTGESIPVIGARLAFANANLDIRMEKIYGDPSLEDVTIVTRQLTVDITAKWNNPDLYRAIQLGSTSATAWSSTPSTGDLNIVVAAPKAITGVAFKNRMIIDVGNVMWQMAGPPTMAAGQAVLVRFIGTVLEPADMATTPYCMFDLHNEKNGTYYVWPT